MSDRRMRRVGFGLATLAGLGRRGFFIPYRYAGRLPAPADLPSHGAIEAWMKARDGAFLALLARAGGYAAELGTIGAAPPPEPRWTQDWFPRLDALAAYVLVREHRPARIVEIGSGHSTRFLARAVRDGGLATDILAIDPAPRADLGRLPVQLDRRMLEAGHFGALETLAAGDVLFVDSSHVAMPGTDLDLLAGQVLPRLAAGVLIQIHDVFLPDPYPAAWAWRGYNEQIVVAALVAGGGFELVWASRYVATRLAAAVAASVAGGLPLPAGAFETSLWLRKITPPLVPGPPPS